MVLDGANERQLLVFTDVEFLLSMKEGQIPTVSWLVIGHVHLMSWKTPTYSVACHILEILSHTE